MTQSPCSTTVPNTKPAVVQADSLYTLEELCRRLRWKRRSRAQALRTGPKNREIRCPAMLFGSRCHPLATKAIEAVASLLLGVVDRGEAVADEIESSGEEYP